MLLARLLASLLLVTLLWAMACFISVYPISVLPALYQRPAEVLLVLFCYFSLHSCFASSTLLRLDLSRAHGARAQVPSFDTTQIIEEVVSIVGTWTIGSFSGDLWPQRGILSVVSRYLTSYF